MDDIRTGVALQFQEKHEGKLLTAQLRKTPMIGNDWQVWSPRCGSGNTEATDN
jgi:hypothetical protein